MSLHSGRRVVSDLQALRALAHPLRLELRALIGRAGPLTAAEAARHLGISQALASHHLRHLARQGFVEPADAVDRRSRPWRLTATSHRWDPGDSRAAQEQVDAIERALVERSAAYLAAWQRRRAPRETRWSAQSGVSQSLLYLTVEEMAQLRRDWEAVVAPLAGRRPLGDAGRRPAGAVAVDVTLVVVPLPGDAAPPQARRKASRRKASR